MAPKHFSRGTGGGTHALPLNRHLRHRDGFPRGNASGSRASRHWIGSKCLSTDVDDAATARHQRRTGISTRESHADADCVIVGNAIPRGNPEVEETLRRKLFYRSQAEVVKEEFIRGRHSLAVAGTPCN